jgi:hypothetical protein
MNKPPRVSRPVCGEMDKKPSNGPKMSMMETADPINHKLLPTDCPKIVVIGKRPA